MAHKPGFCIFALALLAGCAGARSDITGSGNPTSSAAPIDPTEADIVAYADLCKRELGIDEPLPDMNCLAGVEVPITINGREISEKDFRSLASRKGGCDRSQWLDGECWTYDFIQRIEIDDDVEAVLNCRQKLYTSLLTPEERIREYESAVARNASFEERERLWRLIFEFDDLGLILRNRKSGKTCFFTFFGKLSFKDRERSYAYYGGWIPAPDREVTESREEIYAKLPEPKPPEGYPERMWNRGPRGGPTGRPNMFFTPVATAKGQCTSCHNHGAFKHSPFIDQAFHGTERIVPSNDRDVPYLPVGRSHQEVFRKARIVEIDTDPVGGESQTCTSCHRLTTGGRGAHDRLEWAIGDDVPQPSHVTRRFPLNAWMPFEHGLGSKDEYHRAYGPMIEALLCCASTPDAIGCRSRPIGPTETDVRLDARGFLSEDSWVSGANSSVPACVPPVAAAP
jgi:hypothetical protein